MDVLPYEPETYPGQDGVTVLGNRQDVAFIEGIAHLAQPRYPEITALLAEHEAQTGYVSMVGELLEGGNNVELITNHGDLIDIAVSHAALYSLIRKLGYPKFESDKPEETEGHIKTGIIISKMVSFLQYNIDGNYTPCTKVLGLLEDETFLSYPKTESTKKHLKDRLLPNEVDRHNRRMRSRVVHMLGEGSLLLALAASGTTDKANPDDPTTINMGKVGTGTLGLMQQPRTYIAPMAVWYQGGHPVMQMADIPRMAPKGDMGETVAHDAMERIAATLTDNVPDNTFIYER